MSASFANFMHCTPTGNPTIVIHHIIPIVRELRASPQPNNKIHNILSKNELVLLE